MTKSKNRNNESNRDDKRKDLNENEHSSVSDLIDENVLHNMNIYAKNIIEKNSPITSSVDHLLGAKRLREEVYRFWSVGQIIDKKAIDQIKENIFGSNLQTNLQKMVLENLYPKDYKPKYEFDEKKKVLEKMEENDFVTQIEPLLTMKTVKNPGEELTNFLNYNELLWGTFNHYLKEATQAYKNNLFTASLAMSFVGYESYLRHEDLNGTKKSGSKNKGKLKTASTNSLNDNEVFSQALLNIGEMVFGNGKNKISRNRLLHGNIKEPISNDDAAKFLLKMNTLDYIFTANRHKEPKVSQWDFRD